MQLVCTIMVSPTPTKANADCPERRSKVACVTSGAYFCRMTTTELTQCKATPIPAEGD
jgi:hypothetical protein